MWGTSDARLGCEERRTVQLCELRGASPKGSSIAADPADGARGTGGAVAGIRAALSKFGRPSIPPERLLRALLLQAFYSVRSEVLLMKQLDYNLLYRWFVGLSLGMPRCGTPWCSLTTANV